MTVHDPLPEKMSVKTDQVLFDGEIMRIACGLFNTDNFGAGATNEYWDFFAGIQGHERGRYLWIQGGTSERLPRKRSLVCKVAV